MSAVHGSIHKNKKIRRSGSDRKNKQFHVPQLSGNKIKHKRKVYMPPPYAVT